MFLRQEPWLDTSPGTCGVTHHSACGVKPGDPTSVWWRVQPWLLMQKCGKFPFYHDHYTPAQRSWRGVYWIYLVRPSLCPPVCRWHGFWSISQVSFGIIISNFICMLMVAIGFCLLIFSDVTFKMAAWQPYWIFWFPDSKFTLTLNINFKLQWHNTYVYG